VHDDIKFHTDRAMSEIALAARCADHRAADAHLSLSALHLERMRELTERLARPRALSPAWQP
jgi:hypothetical protein